MEAEESEALVDEETKGLYMEADLLAAYALLGVLETLTRMCLTDSLVCVWTFFFRLLCHAEQEPREAQEELQNYVSRGRTAAR